MIEGISIAPSAKPLARNDGGFAAFSRMVRPHPNGRRHVDSPGVNVGPYSLRRKPGF